MKSSEEKLSLMIAFTCRCGNLFFTPGIGYQLEYLTTMCLIIVLISVNGIWAVKNKGLDGEDPPPPPFSPFSASRLPLSFPHV